VKLPTVLFVSWLTCAVTFAMESPAEIPLWPNGAPGSEGKKAKEVVAKSASGEISVCSNQKSVGAWITRFFEWMNDSGFVKR